MSLYGTLNTSISGMQAQTNKLSAIGDNIANSSTTGYKRASTEFETLLGYQTSNYYESGGVQTRVRYGVAEQGTITATTSSTDLAIEGNGFFLVQNNNGLTAMTRAGSFVPDANGNLVNTAGYKLMGYNLSSGTSAPELINISSQGLVATPSTKATLSANLPSTATAATGNLPSSNAADASFTEKDTSLVAYDNLGKAVTLDVYFTKTGDNTWQATVYNHADAAAGGGFPYSSAALANQTLTFNSSNGSLTTASAQALSVAIPNGNTISIDLSKTTQLAANYGVSAATIDGNAPSKLDHVTVGEDGTVSAVYANGTSVAEYRVAMATVESPDNLTSLNGDVYMSNPDSGPMIVGTAGTGTFGKIDSSALEASTVDLATELTSMISAQRGYEANSKVLQASSDLLKVLNNLQV